MKKWKISLLGAPRATRGAETARLRSRETWGVLASLVLANTQRKQADAEPGCCSRESLADRFWSDARDPSHCLRQSIASIRSELGPECVIADRHNVSLEPRCATSDIEIIKLLLGKAACDDSKRLQLLSEADSYLQGSFLEGCIDPGDNAYNWFVAIRAVVDGLVLQVLEGLVQCQEAAGDLNSAFDSARRALQYKSEDPIALERLWDLGRRTNRPHIAETITAANQFEDALPRITQRARKGLPLTTRESRIFDSVFQDRLALLDERTRLRFLSLSVFPTAFTVELAHRVCRTPVSVLDALADHRLLERDRDNNAFSFLEPVRASAIRRVQPATLQRLQQRLFEVCDEHIIIGITTGDNARVKPFTSAKGAILFLSSALDWVISGKNFVAAIYYIDRLREFRHGEIASRAIPWIELNLCNDVLTLQDRLCATHCLGKLFTDSHRFRDAIPCYEHALEIATTNGLVDMEVALHGYLAVAYHHAELPELAVRHNSLEGEFYAATHDIIGMAGSLRFRGEILTALGDTEGVLNALSEACILYRRIETLALSLAECLYWMSEAYTRLGKQDDALEALEESLNLRLEGSDSTGIGHCLAKIGAIRSQQGRKAEGRAQILHAILLHEQSGDRASRAAALGMLGDALLREGKYDEAGRRYAEGLEYWQVQQHSRWCENFRRRLSKC